MLFYELKNKAVELKRWCKYYSLFDLPYRYRMFVFMVDGRFYHGGMADRFKGIVSTYAYCKANSFPFKINYNMPFLLQDYLVPNYYNWLFGEDEFLSYNSFFSKPLILAKDIKGKKLCASRKKLQYHVYYNRDCLDAINIRYNKHYQWGELFKELFIPVPRLKYEIERNYKLIGEDYIAIVFRFQSLLGDFDEGNFLVLPLSMQKLLIKRCLYALNELRERHGNTRFLITSDSISFLNEVSKIKDCFIIPGKLVHMEYTNNSTYDVHLKSFVDFFMLSKSKKIYSVGTPEMYKTEFPLYASKIEDISFERILLPSIYEKW